MKKASIVVIVAILGLNTTGCASNPINTNCVTISGKQVANPNHLPSKGTAAGAGVGVGTGAVIGGIIGFTSGVTTTSLGILGAIPGAFAGPILVGVFTGAVGAGVGALIGLAIGSASGYAYDYSHANNVFEYHVACGNPNGQKFYNISNNKLIIESAPEILYLNAIQSSNKQIESGTTVNLFSNSDGYYIKQQPSPDESINK
ncbi:MAG: hypothetical protein ACK5Z5_01380 [Neisseriaceae bacterium]